MLAPPANTAETRPTPEPPRSPGRLSARDAIDIWIARWLRVTRKELCRRYRCDPRRLYEIWEERRFPEARAYAVEEFGRRFPALVERIDFGPHRRVPRVVPPGQLDLFD
jgi:hypothetical protein